MTTAASTWVGSAAHPVHVTIDGGSGPRNRLTTAFRLILAIPHLLLVGGPTAVMLWWTWSSERGAWDWSIGGGALGAVAAVAALIAWFAIVFTGRHPDGLWNLTAMYLRWRVRAVAYITLLRDEYPPFGDADYPASLVLPRAPAQRDRLTVAFRIFLALPHIIVLWILGVAWAITTLIGWFAILFTGTFPAELRDFGAGMLQWNTRLEAYVLLLRDEYPPFSLH